jgi:hypothetical protein
MQYMQKPKKEVMKASDVRNNWREVVNDVFTNNKLIELTKSGLVVGGLIGPDDLRLLLSLKSQRVKLNDLLNEMSERFEAIPEEEIVSEIENARLEIWDEDHSNKSQE